MNKYRLNIDGKEVYGLPGQTILEVCRENDIFIPTLCYDERTEIYGACGLCVVEQEGNPKLWKACATEIAPNMIIHTNTPRVIESRKTNLELLLSNHKGDCRPPCMLACPAGTDCQGYVGLIANGQYEEAIKLIRENIPLPGSIGRVCPHPCETACRRGMVDEPIAIANLKRFAADTDEFGEDPFVPEWEQAKGKKVAVIGGGLAGMEAARVAAVCGHDVTIYERSGELGGHLIEAGAHPFKRGIARLNDWYKNQLKALNVNVELNCAMTSEDITALKPDVAVLAVGSEHFVPPIPGRDKKNAAVCYDVLMGKRSVGQNVVVVGGGLTGSELAYDLAAYQKKNVTLVEALDDILSAGMAVPQAVDNMLRDLLDYNHVTIKTGCMLTEVTDNGAIVTDKAGNKVEIPADDVIFAIGLKPNKSLADELAGTGIEVYELGDGTGIGNIRTAISGAYEVMRKV